jgi:hypothetical protein
MAHTYTHSKQQHQHLRRNIRKEKFNYLNDKRQDGMTILAYIVSSEKLDFGKILSNL